MPSGTASVADFRRSSLMEPLDLLVSRDALGCWQPEGLDGVPGGFDGAPEGLDGAPDGLDGIPEGLDVVPEDFDVAPKGLG